MSHGDLPKSIGTDIKLADGKLLPCLSVKYSTMKEMLKDLLSGESIFDAAKSPTALSFSMSNQDKVCGMTEFHM